MPSRLCEFRIDGLFGLYDHRITLNQKDRITIIIGPNGRGKTVCLKLIEALFEKKFSYFAEILFRSAQFIFSTGETISVAPVELQKTETPGGICFTLSAPDKENILWTPAPLDGRFRRELRRYIPSHWAQISSDLWMDERDGEEVTTAELVERHHVPPKILAILQQDIPEELVELLNRIDCHLIETQRLLVLPSGAIHEGMEYATLADPRRRTRVSRLAIQQKAEKLKTIIKDTLGSYATLAQSLDRSFPLRVFEAQGTATLSQDELRQELKQLDERREAMMHAGILETEYKAVTMRPGNIEPGVAMALEIYVRDAVKKLNVFNNLLSRLDLFKELIARRFIDKSIIIDRECGFKIISKTGAEVPLDRLSSGEQHQLILTFDLLFEVTENSLILIDEPELSLHVTWQKSFIESLRRIISLNGFDVLLATHSPAVVARHFNLAIELGPVDE